MTKAKLSVALYSSRDGFPKQSEKALARASSAIADKKAVCNFSGIAPGTYAISVFHDENSNGKLDTKFVGIPPIRPASAGKKKGKSNEPNTVRGNGKSAGAPHRKKRRRSLISAGNSDPP